MIEHFFLLKKKSVFDMHPWPKKKKKENQFSYLVTTPTQKKQKLKIGCLGGF
jgi:hypothetical protein